MWGTERALVGQCFAVPMATETNLDNIYDSQAMRQISELPTCRQHIMTATNIRLVTSNPNKLADIGAILSAASISIQSVAIDLVEIQGTVEEISIAKCRAAAEIVRRVLSQESVIVMPC